MSYCKYIYNTHWRWTDWEENGENIRKAVFRVLLNLNEVTALWNAVTPVNAKFRLLKIEKKSCLVIWLVGIFRHAINRLRECGWEVKVWIQSETQWQRYHSARWRRPTLSSSVLWSATELLGRPACLWVMLQTSFQRNMCLQFLIIMQVSDYFCQSGCESDRLFRHGLSPLCVWLSLRFRTVCIESETFYPLPCISKYDRNDLLVFFICGPCGKF